MQIQPASLAFTLLIGFLAAVPYSGIDINLPALAATGATLGVSPSEVGLTMSAFMLSLAAAPLFYGPVSDRFRRKPVDGDVPDHSTFSRNRHGRFRESDLLRKLFETVVARCIKEGVVGGEAFAVDAIVADAYRRRGVAKAASPRSRTSIRRPAARLRNIFRFLTMQPSAARRQPNRRRIRRRSGGPLHGRGPTRPPSTPIPTTISST